jgi:hypothetical protein
MTAAGRGRARRLAAVMMMAVSGAASATAQSAGAAASEGLSPDGLIREERRRMVRDVSRRLHTQPTQQIYAYIHMYTNKATTPTPLPIRTNDTPTRAHTLHLQFK